MVRRRGLQAPSLFRRWIAFPFVCSVGSCRAAEPRSLPSSSWRWPSDPGGGRITRASMRPCSDPDPGARSSPCRHVATFLDRSCGRRPVLSAGDGAAVPPGGWSRASELPGGAGRGHSDRRQQEAEQGLEDPEEPAHARARLCPGGGATASRPASAAAEQLAVPYADTPHLPKPLRRDPDASASSRRCRQPRPFIAAPPAGCPGPAQGYGAGAPAGPGRRRPAATAHRWRTGRWRGRPGPGRWRG
jgi:hypothetical protein